MNRLNVVSVENGEENWKYYLLIVTIVLGALALFIGLISTSAMAATLPANVDTDMVVTGDETYEDSFTELDANITVASGGNLTMNNVTLNITSGKFIQVNSSGRLMFNASKMMVNGTSYDIIMLDGGTMILMDSDISGYGMVDISGPDATIKNNELSPATTSDNGLDFDYASASFSSDGPDIMDNNITACHYGIYMDAASSTMQNITIQNNYFASVGNDAIWFDGSFMTLGGMDIQDNMFNGVNDEGVYLDINDATVFGLNIMTNDFTSISGTAIDLYARYINTTPTTVMISDNEITTGTDDGVLIEGDYGDWGDLTISNNNITSMGIYYAVYFDIQHGTIGDYTLKDNNVQDTTYGFYQYDRYTDWGSITIQNNSMDSMDDNCIYFYPYDTSYGDILIDNNTWTNTANYDEVLRMYYSSWSSSYAPEFQDLTFTNNNATNVGDDLMYWYTRYSNMWNVTISNNTFNTIDGDAIYMYNYYASYDNLTVNDNYYYDIDDYSNYFSVYSEGVRGDINIHNNEVLDVTDEWFYFYGGYGGDYGDIIIKNNSIENVLYDDAIYLYLYRSDSIGDIVINDNEIDKAGDVGIYIYAYYVYDIGNFSFINNNFTETDDDGLYFYSYYGDMGDIKFIGNNMLGDMANYAYGIYFYPRYGSANNLTIRDNVITKWDGYGFYCYMYRKTLNNAKITNNTLKGNDYEGLYFYNPYSGNTNVTISDNTVVSNDDWGIYTSVYGGGGKLQINNNLFANNNYGISIDGEDKDTLIIQNNTVVSNEYDGMDIDLYYFSGKALITDNQCINNRRGIEIWGYNSNYDQASKFANNTMIKNDVGLIIDELEELRIEENTITNNNQQGIYFYGDYSTALTLSLYNNKIVDNNVDMYIEMGYIIKSFNNTFDTYTLTNSWGNVDPELWVMSYIDVQVLWLDGSGPVADADLQIYDVVGNLLLDDRVDNQGWYKDIEVVLFTADPDGEYRNTPFTINASKYGIKASIEVDGESQTAIQIYLDNVPPDIVISTPEDMMVTNKERIKVAGQTEPTATVIVNDVEINLTVAGTFEYFVDLLKEGNNDIRVVAMDEFNNTDTILLHVIKDTVDPPLEIHSPEDGETTNSPSLLVEGETEPGAIAKVNEQEVEVDDIGRFEHTVLLAEGENEVTVVVEDEAGNEVKETRKVFLDSVPPTIDILTPPNGLITNLKEVEIRGIAEGAETVKVNGINLKILGETFASSYKLQPGTNTLLFEAWDEVGNYASYELTVTQDKNPPQLEVISPKDNMFTGNEVLVVSGSSEPGNDVTVNGVRVTLDPNNGIFTQTVLLKEGTNRIVVRSVDSIGNTIEVVRNVFLDTTPPILTVTNPADGIVTSNPRVVVEGIVEVNSELTINGEPLTIEQGTFKKTLNLEEGANRIVIVATDKAGNKATVIRSVYLDTRAGIQIFAPADQLRTTQENITFMGQVEEGALLKINGLDIQQDNQSRFNHQFSLDLGTNDFEIVVTDANGNTNTIYRSVIREEVPEPPSKKKDVEEGGDDNTLLWAALVSAGIAFLIAVLMFFLMSWFYRQQRREPPFGPEEEGMVEAEERPFRPMEEEEEDLDKPLPPPPPPSRTEEEEPEVPPEPPKGISDTAAEGEIDVDENDLEQLASKVEKLEQEGADTTKAKQSLRMAKIYLEKNRKEKADKHLHKAEQILTELDSSSAEIEATGGEVEMKEPERPAPPPPGGDEDKPKEIPRVPPPPGAEGEAEEDKPRAVRRVKRVRKAKKGGEEE